MAYQTRDVVEAMTRGRRATPIAELRVDGGASAMDLLVPDPGRPARRAGGPPRRCSETTALGAAYLAGLAEGVWSSTDELAALWQLDLRCEPVAPTEPTPTAATTRWLAAVARARAWDRPT